MQLGEGGVVVAFGGGLGRVTDHYALDIMPWIYSIREGLPKRVSSPFPYLQSLSYGEVGEVVVFCGVSYFTSTPVVV